MNERFLKSSTTERILAAAGIIITFGGAAFVWFFNPTTAGFFPACPLFQMTGIACPGCGMTRGFHAFFHGDFLTALDYNAMLPIYLFIFAYLLVAMVAIAVRGRMIIFQIFKPNLIWGFLILSLLFALLRNLPYYPFTILYP